jgi:TrmH family RNA methyltransferase
VLIDSPHNQHIKFFRALHERKGRLQHQAFLGEGARLIAEALAAGYPLRAAAICEELLSPAARPLAARLAAGPWPCHLTTARAFRALSAEQHPQGLAIAAAQRLTALHQLPLGPRDLIVVAWDLQEPGNMGTLIRTAEFLGAQALLAVGDCVDFFEPKVVRATAGAIFHLPLASAAPQQFWAWAEQGGVQVLAAMVEGGSPPEEVHGQGPWAVLVGSEAHGLPAQALRRATRHVTIPRRGRLDSLNATIAAAICLYHLTRQLSGEQRR